MPSSSPEVFEGRCQCGALRYRVTGETVALFVCHCTECQHQSASAFGMALWLRGYDKRVFGEGLSRWVRATPSGKRLVGEFCSRCGTRLFHQVASQPEILSIKPGTLDTLQGLEPIAHIWTSSAQPWVHLADDTLRYPQNPPHFDEIFAAWQARNTGASHRMPPID